MVVVASGLALGDLQQVSSVGLWDSGEPWKEVPIYASESLSRRRLKGRSYRSEGEAIRATLTILICGLTRHQGYETLRIAEWP